MSGIQTIWEDFWDGLVSESRREEKGIPSAAAHVVRYSLEIK